MKNGGRYKHITLQVFFQVIYVATVIGPTNNNQAKNMSFPNQSVVYVHARVLVANVVATKDAWAKQDTASPA